MKFPEDDIYPESFVNYVKLDRLPKFDEDRSPIVRAMRAGQFFVSSGEVLLKQFAVEGTGSQRTVTAEFDWTFPLDFVEVVWGNGQKTDRQIIATTDLPPFSNKRFSLPLDATGKDWVRVAAWDSAGIRGLLAAGAPEERDDLRGAVTGRPKLCDCRVAAAV